MFERLRGAVGELRSLVGELEPDCFDGPGARTLVELFDEVERLGAAGKALATRQVVATGAWKHDGAHRDAASWLAGTTGSTVGAARATVDTAARVAELPATEAALRAGTLSLTQVEAIADAATADPGAEAELLERAAHDGVRGLRTACARVKAAACTDEAAQYDRIRAARSVRGWTDPDGTGRIDIRGPVDATAKIMAALEPYERALFKEARTAGRREPSDALAFDALVALVSAERSTDDDTGAPSVTTVVRVDYGALLRGHTLSGEVCEIVGGGPIPVSVAQRMMEDSFLKVLLVDGTDVRLVSHPGRAFPPGCAPPSTSSTRSATSRGATSPVTSRSTTTSPSKNKGPPRCGTWVDCAAITTTRSTGTSGGSSASPAACASSRRTSGCRRDRPVGISRDRSPPGGGRSPSTPRPW